MRQVSDLSPDKPSGGFLFELEEEEASFDLEYLFQLARAKLERLGEKTQDFSLAFMERAKLPGKSGGIRFGPAIRVAPYPELPAPPRPWEEAQIERTPDPDTSSKKEPEEKEVKQESLF